jgi:glycosyltransferase involved in cell wall biosynthesis
VKENEQTLITTIIPTYRRPALLRRAIASVLEQSFASFQVHVYDDASGVKTAEIVANIAAREPRVKYHSNPVRMRIMRNFAQGIWRVKTPFFNILSDDDLLLPELFQRAMRAFQKNPDAAFVLEGLLYSRPDGTICGCPTAKIKEPTRFESTQFLEAFGPGGWTWTSTVFRTEAIHAVGGLNLDVGYAGDVDLMLRASLLYPVVVSGVPGASVTVHPRSASISDWRHVVRDELSLSRLTSIEETMTRAVSRGAVSGDAARTAMRVLKSRMERAFFLRALILLASGDRETALDLASALRSGLNRGDLSARVCSLAGGDSLGMLAGAALLALRNIKHAKQAASAKVRFHRQTVMMKKYLHDLESRCSEPNCSECSRPLAEANGV